MSTTIDERVVEMRFDNKQFESNVSTTISTLDKLKEKLNLSGASKGLESIDTAARNCDLSVLGRAAETVGLKFNAMYTIADQALRNITNSAVNAGKRIVSALTIDPIKTGFSEYETQINAVQTILANTESKGKTLDDVNAALDELNTYADKTIYNFTEMTRNIGTFTAAGVDLDTSVSAIKGIANLAAVSGSTSQQASTAMYQLSQALASGTVKLMDWNSVVNAGMGGQVFQDALKETARAHNIAIDDIIKKQGSFRESLSEGWLTSDILTETLSKFTGDLTEEQLKSMGYTEEQIKGIVKMGKTANDAATKVKTFSQLFDTLKEAAQSGWTQTWEIIVGDFEEAKAFLTEVSDTIGGIIGSSAEARNELLENWKVLGGRTALIDSVRNAFEGIISIITPIKEAFREIFPPITAEQLFSFTEGLKNLTSKLKIGEDTSENLKRTFKGLFAVLDIARQIFVAVVKAASSLFGTVGELGGGILGMTASFGDWLVNLNETIKASDIFNRVLRGVVEVIKAAAGGVKSFFKFIKEKIAFPGLELFHSLLEKTSEKMSGVGGVAKAMKDGVVSTFDAISSTLENCSLIKVLEAVWKVVVAIGSVIGKVFGSLFGGLVNAFSNADFEGILNFINTLILGGVGASLVKWVKGLSEPLEGLGDIFDGVKGIANSAKDIFDGVLGNLEEHQNKLKTESLMKIATAIAILVASIFVLSTIDSDKIADAIGAITVLFAELSASLSFVSKLNGGKGLVTMGVAMVTLSTSLLILAVALKILSTMSLSEMGAGFIVIAGGLSALVMAVKMLPEKDVAKASSAIKKMSTALLILAVALKIMSSMSWSEMAVGLITMATSLGVLVGALYLLPKDVSSKTAGMIALATSLVILAAALKIMATMSWAELAVGLVALAGSMAILVVSLKLMNSALSGAAAMLIVAPALVVLAAALKILGSMSLEEVLVGLIAVGGALVILAISLNAMTSALPGAAALVVASAALAILAPVLLLLGSMSWESVIKGLVSIAGAITIIGVAGYLLAPIIPSILALAGAIALIGVGTLAAGLGLMAFGAGLSAVAVGITALVTSLSTVLTGIVAVVKAIVVGIITGIGEGIIALCTVIKEGAPAICEALTAIIVSLCDALVASVPALVNCIDVVLTALLDFLVSFTPKLIDAGIDLVVGLLDGISRNIGKVIDAGIRVVMSFIEGIVMMIPKIINQGIDIMVKFINGMADGIRTNTAKIIAAVNNLMSAVFEAIGMAIGNVPELGRQICSGLIKGIKQGMSSVVESAKNLAKSAWNGIKNFFGINSPAKLTIGAGMDVDEGLAVGLKKYAKVASKAAVGVGETTMSSLSDAISGISDFINDDIDAEPTIRPVLDLSDVKSGAGSISSILGTGASVGVLANVGAISSSMNRNNQNGDSSDVVSAINKLRKDIGNIKSETYQINGVTYDDGSNLTDAVKTIVRAARVERRT